MNNKIFVLMLSIVFSFCNITYLTIPASAVEYNNDGDNDDDEFGETDDDEFGETNNDNDDEFGETDDEESNENSSDSQDISVDDDEEDDDVTQSKKLSTVKNGKVGSEPDHWLFNNITLGNDLTIPIYSTPKLKGGITLDGYYITKDDYNLLTDDLIPSELEMVRESYFLDNLDDVYASYALNVDNDNPDNYYEPYGGACYGFSVTSALVDNKIIKPYYLNNKSSLGKSGRKATPAVTSAINFYYIQQLLLPCQTAREQFQKLSIKEQSSRIIAAAKRASKTKKTSELSIYWSDNHGLPSGHSVLICGIRKVNKTWHRSSSSYDDCLVKGKGKNAHTYDTKVYVFDSNNPLDGSDAIYIDSKTGEWCYPYYGIISSSNKGGDQKNNDKHKKIPEDNNGKFGDLLYSKDYLNTVSYIDGSHSNLYKKLEKKQLAKDNDMVRLVIPADQTYNIESSDGKASIDGISITESTYNDNDILTSVVTTGKNKKIIVSIPKGDASYKISSDKDMRFLLNSGDKTYTVNADSSGSITIDDEQGKVEAEYNEKTTENSIKITSNAQNLMNISGCSAVGTSMPGATNATVSVNDESMDITSNNTSNLVVNSEVNNNVSPIKINSDYNSIKISGTGTDTNTLNVIADADGDGIYDKPVETIQIQKQIAQKIKIKRKTYKIKKGKTAKISAKAKTKLSYRKLTGNDKITVSKSGKVKVSKKLKKGTYKIKVRVNASASQNYKKSSKKVILKIKVVK